MIVLCVVVFVRPAFNYSVDHSLSCGERGMARGGGGAAGKRPVVMRGRIPAVFFAVCAAISPSPLSPSQPSLLFGYSCHV